MRESLTEVVTGGAVLLIAGGFLLWAAGGTERIAGGDGITLTASFRSAEGVTPGTDVRMAGVKIGTVAGLTLDPETFRADTRLALTTPIAIPDDSAAVVATEGLLGGTFVEIVPGGSLTAFEDGGEVYDTQGAVSLLQLLLTYVGGGSET